MHLAWLRERRYVYDLGKEQWELELELKFSFYLQL